MSGQCHYDNIDGFHDYYLVPSVASDCMLAMGVRGDLVRASARSQSMANLTASGQPAI